MARKIWFYDNDFNNRTSRNEIKFIKVEDSSKIVPGLLAPYYPNIEHSVEQLKTAVEQNSVLCVVFDWDRTLSKTEGLFGAPPHADLSIKKYREYLKGGFEQLSDFQFVSYYFNNLEDYEPSRYSSQKRADMIGDLLNFLFENRIPIFVLTNSRVGYDSPEIMSNMLTVLAGREVVPTENVLYNYLGSKERVIMQDIYKILVSMGYKENFLKRTTMKYGERKSRRKGVCEKCVILGVKRKTRRKRKKTKRKRSKKSKSSKTRKLNV